MTFLKHFLILIAMTAGSLQAQNKEFVSQLIEDYDHYKESRLKHRRFKHLDMQPLLEKLTDQGFQVKTLGQSYEGRDIKLVSIGEGPINILMWSQMHGNEATATMALFDLFAYLSQDSQEVRNMLTKVSLHFIPMLNPDGTQVFQRRTAQGIDMNRDALNLACPESNILKETREALNADFGFNLHDQNIYYTVGQTGQPATISFLAPAYNEEKEVNAIRKSAMQVIAVMDEALQSIIPGKVAKYDDTFEPRAFGDNIQKWGSSTILIESGGYAGDPEKQHIRRLNFIALAIAIHSIAESQYQNIDEARYWQIPDNHRNLNDLLIKGLTVNGPQGAYPLDVAIRRAEQDKNGQLPLRYYGSIEDSGDLSTKYGYQVIDAQGLEYAGAQVYPQTLADIEAAQRLDIAQLMKLGYTALRLAKLPPFETKFPLDLLNSERTPPAWGLLPEQAASFVLMDSGLVRYVIINGYLHDLKSETNLEAHGSIFK